MTTRQLKHIKIIENGFKVNEIIFQLRKCMHNVLQVHIWRSYGDIQLLICGSSSIYCTCTQMPRTVHVILYPTCIVSTSNCPGSWKSITDLIVQTNEPSIQYQHSLHLIPLLNVVSQILWCHHLHIGLLPRQVCQQTNKQMPTSFMQGKLAFLAIKIILNTTSYYKELKCFVRFQQRDMCFDKQRNKYFGNINSKY